jgi:branched-chain amino acid aminotransferase
VALGLHGNLFLRKGTEIKTPPLSGGCPDGILRKFLLGRDWERTGFRLSEGEISPFELQQADELFMVDTALGVSPVAKYRKAEFGREAAAAATVMINGAIGGTP